MVRPTNHFDLLVYGQLTRRSASSPPSLPPLSQIFIFRFTLEEVLILIKSQRSTAHLGNNNKSSSRWQMRARFTKPSHRSSIESLHPSNLSILSPSSSQKYFFFFFTSRLIAFCFHSNQIVARQISSATSTSFVCVSVSFPCWPPSQWTRTFMVWSSVA